MSRLPNPLLIGLIALVATGCADRSKVIGTWRGERPATVHPGQEPAAAGTLALVKLTMKPDGGFDLTEEGFSKSGRAVAEGKAWRLTIDRVLDRPVASLGPGGEQMGGERRLTPQPDGTMVFSRPRHDDVLLKRTN